MPGFALSGGSDRGRGLVPWHSSGRGNIPDRHERRAESASLHCLKNPFAIIHLVTSFHISLLLNDTSRSRFHKDEGAKENTCKYVV